MTNLEKLDRDRLYVVAGQLAVLCVDDYDQLNLSVHVRDLKTVITRLLERIETLQKPDQK